MNRFFSIFLLTSFIGAGLRADTLPESLGRKRGQTVFRNAEGVGGYGRGPMRAMAMSASAKSVTLESADGGSAKRETQESDVFKMAPDGTLYLLNNARGLQAIKVDDEGAKLDLMSRAKVPGEEIREMYVDKKNNRILVLSSYQVDPEKADWKTASRVSVFDISNPKRITWTQDLDFEGDISDSRLVGNILYIVNQGTELVDEYNPSGETKSFGKVRSFDISKKEVSAVDEHTLALQAAGRENMSIQEEEYAPGKFRYYLVAVLENERWGSWWATSSKIEVVKISDPKGKIEPIMVVAPKGFVDKRQQVHIEKNQLVVASNYYLNADGTRSESRWGSTGRVAVETFDFPTASSERIDAEEFAYREAHLKRQVAAKIVAQTKDGKTVVSDTMKDAIAASFDNDELGLKGRFTQLDNSLEKLRSDSFVSSGDSRGESASLQEVRFVDDLVLAFWVPANLVDPLDIFQRTPKGLKYRGRLEFEGWIQKSFVQKIDGRLFMIALGWHQAATDQRWNRKLQIKLFEIENPSEGKFVPKDLSTLIVEDKNLFTNLSDLDKLFTLSIDSKGKGYLMFKAGAYSDQGYRSGAKVIEIDISKAGQAEVFVDHPMMTVDNWWLNRVFQSPNKFAMTFSNSQLGLFPRKLTELQGGSERRISYVLTLKKKKGKSTDPNTEAIAALTELLAKLPEVEVLSTVDNLVEVSVPENYSRLSELLDHDLVDSSAEGATFVRSTEVNAAPTVLELSRNISSYFPLVGSGLQLIASNGYYNNKESSTELRLVPHADAELNDALAVKELRGNLLASKRLSDGRILFLTQQRKAVDEKSTEEAEDSYQFALTYVSQEGSDLKIEEWMTFALPQPEDAAPVPGAPRRGIMPGRGNMPRRFYGGASSLREIRDGEFLMTVSGMPLILKLNASGESPIQFLPENVNLAAKSGDEESSSGASIRYFVFNGEIWAYWSEVDAALSDELSALNGEEASEAPRVGSRATASVAPRGQNRVRTVIANAHYIAKFEGGKLQTKINIPGEPISMSKTGELLVKDSALMDLDVDPSQGGALNTLNRSLVVALQISGGQAVLSDLRDQSASFDRRFQIGDTSISLNQPASTGGYNYHLLRTRRASRPELETVRVNAEGQLEETRQFIRGFTLQGYLYMLDVIEDRAAGRYFGLVSNGRLVQVVTWTKENSVPTVIESQMLNEHNELNEPSNVIQVPYGYSFFRYSWDGVEGKISYNPTTGRLSFAAGNAGVCEAYLLTNAATEAVAASPAPAAESVTASTPVKTKRPAKKGLEKPAAKMKAKTRKKS